MPKQILVVLGFVGAMAWAHFSSGSPELTDGTGDSEHSEIYRLRCDIASIKQMFVAAVGLLGAILMALIFEEAAVSPRATHRCNRYQGGRVCQAVIHHRPLIGERTQRA